jgi:hypothetical protein
MQPLDQQANRPTQTALSNGSAREAPTHDARQVFVQNYAGELTPIRQQLIYIKSPPMTVLQPVHPPSRAAHTKIIKREGGWERT